MIRKRLLDPRDTDSSSECPPGKWRTRLQTRGREVFEEREATGGPPVPLGGNSQGRAGRCLEATHFCRNSNAPSASPSWEAGMITSIPTGHSFCGPWHSGWIAGAWAKGNHKGWKNLVGFQSQSVLEYFEQTSTFC